MRICENSAKLGGVVACMYRYALASTIIGSSWANVDSGCPSALGVGEPCRSYGDDTAPVSPTDPNPITCQVC